MVVFKIKGARLLPSPEFRHLGTASLGGSLANPWRTLAQLGYR